MKRRNISGAALQDALLKSYIARAKLFYAILQEKNVAGLFSKIGRLPTHGIKWNLAELGIDPRAFSAAKRARLNPAHIFCHPDNLSGSPDLLEYYRNLAAVSRKGLAQILSGQVQESGVARKADRRNAITHILNHIVSAVIVDTKTFTLPLAQNAILAEMGTEIQGTWANIIGKGAAKAVEQVVREYARAKGFISSLETKDLTISGKNRKQVHIVLKNGWRIIFSSEPDVSVRNADDRLQAAIEIKGSMDKAGAQTRLGEAKKSFAKAKAENAHCKTIYLASCFTDAVLAQLKTEREVDQHFNLVDILADDSEKTGFLRELFHYIARIE